MMAGEIDWKRHRDRFWRSYIDSLRDPKTWIIGILAGALIAMIGNGCP